MAKKRKGGRRDFKRGAKRGKGRKGRNAASRAAAALNRARKRALTGKRRSEIARGAAKARWQAARAQEATGTPTEDHNDGN